MSDNVLSILQTVKEFYDTFEFFFVGKRNADFSFAFFGTCELHFGLEEAGKTAFQDVVFFG